MRERNVTVTAKLRVIVTSKQRTTLDQTMEVYRQACNYTEYKFSEIEFSIIMHKETIRVKPESETLRDKTGSAA